MDMTLSSSAGRVAANRDMAGVVRWSGLAAVAAGVGLMIASVAHPPATAEGFASAAWLPAHLLYFAALVLTQLALVGAYARLAPVGGRLGVAGFVLSFMATGMMLMEGREHTLALPIFHTRLPEIVEPLALPQLVLTSILFSVGWMIFSVALARGGLLPVGTAAALGLGAVLLAFAPPIGIPAVAVGATVLFGGALMVLGRVLWRERRR